MVGNEKNVASLIKDEMAEAGIVVETNNTLSYFLGNREYLVSINVFDVTDWEGEA